MTRSLLDRLDIFMKVIRNFARVKTAIVLEEILIDLIRCALSRRGIV